MSGDGITGTTVVGKMPPTWVCHIAPHVSMTFCGLQNGFVVVEVVNDEQSLY